VVAINSADANNCHPQYCFVQFTDGLGKSEDALLCISTSGDAKRVILAAIVAKAKNMNVIGLTRKTGGMLAQHCDVCIKVPESEAFEVQELDLPTYDTLLVDAPYDVLKQLSGQLSCRRNQRLNGDD
jgi:D-sedoheptulose 7-phosphate isomerase